MAVLPLVPVWISAFFPDHVREHALPDVAGGSRRRFPAADRQPVLDLPASLALGLCGNLPAGMGGPVQLRLLQHHAHLVPSGPSDDGSVQAADMVRLLPHGHHDADDMSAPVQKEITRRPAFS